MPSTGKFLGGSDRFFGILWSDFLEFDCTGFSHWWFQDPPIFSSTGHRLITWPIVRRASVHLWVFFFLKHLLCNYLADFDEISQRAFCYGPLKKFLKEFDSFKNSGCRGNKTWKFLKSLKIFLSKILRLRASKFGMYLHLMGLYQVSSNLDPPWGSQVLHGTI